MSESPTGDETVGHRRRGVRHDRTNDRGASLIEIVIAVTLLATVLGALVSATTTGVRVSSEQRSSALVETAVVNAADRLNRAPKQCDYGIYVEAAVLSQGWAPDSVQLVQEYYVAGTSPTVAGSWATGDPATPGCPGAAPDDLLVQRVTLTITDPEDGVRRSIQVVKSDV